MSDDEEKDVGYCKACLERIFDTEKYELIDGDKTNIYHTKCTELYERKRRYVKRASEMVYCDSVFTKADQKKSGPIKEALPMAVVSIQNDKLEKLTNVLIYWTIALICIASLDIIITITVYQSWLLFIVVSIVIVLMTTISAYKYGEASGF